MADVRIASPEDAQGIVSLVNAVAAEDRTLGVDAFPFDAETQSRLIAAHDPLVELPLVAVDREQVVGFLHASRGTSDALRHVSSLAIVVARSHRHAGVGQSLLTSMANWAQVVGVRKLTLSVLATNEGARCLFEKFGYTLEGHRKGQFHIGREDVDELLMARWLQGTPTS